MPHTYGNDDEPAAGRNQDRVTTDNPLSLSDSNSFMSSIFMDIPQFEGFDEQLPGSQSLRVTNENGREEDFFRVLRHEATPEKSCIPVERRPAQNQTYQSSFQPSETREISSSFQPAPKPTFKSSFEAAQRLMFPSSFEPEQNPTFPPSFEPSQIFCERCQTVISPSFETSFQTEQKQTFQPSLQSEFQSEFQPAQEQMFQPSFESSLPSLFQTCYQPSFKPFKPFFESSLPSLFQTCYQPSFKPFKPFFESSLPSLFQTSFQPFTSSFQPQLQPMWQPHQTPGHSSGTGIGTRPSSKFEMMKNNVAMNNTTFYSENSMNFLFDERDKMTSMQQSTTSTALPSNTQMKKESLGSTRTPQSSNLSRRLN